MGEHMSHRQMLLAAIVLGFLAGFIWVNAVQPFLTRETSAYARAD